MATRYSLFFFVFFTLNILQTYFADFFENKRFGYVIVSSRLGNVKIENSN